MLTHHGTWILETTASWTSSIGRSENHSTMFSVTFGWKKFWWRRGSGSEEAKPTRFRFLWRWFQDTEDTLRMEIREVGGGGGWKPVKTLVCRSWREPGFAMDRSHEELKHPHVFLFLTMNTQSYQVTCRCLWMPGASEFQSSWLHASDTLPLHPYLPPLSI